MSGSGFDEINSTQNQSNSTDPNLKKLALTFAEAGAFVQTFVQLLLCTIAFVAIVRVRALRVGRNVYMVNMVLSDIARVIIGLLVFIYGMMTQKFGSLAQKNFCVYSLSSTLAFFLVNVGNYSHRTKSLFDHLQSSRTWRIYATGGNREYRHLRNGNRHCHASALYLGKVYEYIFY